MNKELIEMYRGVNSSCVITVVNGSNELQPCYTINVTDTKQYISDKKLDLMKRLDINSKISKISYLIINGIADLQQSKQDEYVGLVKDRCVGNYVLPKNCIIVFTVRSQNDLSKIAPNLYRLAYFAN